MMRFDARFFEPPTMHESRLNEPIDRALLAIQSSTLILAENRGLGPDQHWANYAYCVSKNLLIIGSVLQHLREDFSGGAWRSPDPVGLADAFPSRSCRDGCGHWLVGGGAPRREFKMELESRWLSFLVAYAGWHGSVMLRHDSSENHPSCKIIRPAAPSPADCGGRGVANNRVVRSHHQRAWLRKNILITAGWTEILLTSIEHPDVELGSRPERKNGPARIHSSERRSLEESQNRMESNS